MKKLVLVVIVCLLAMTSRATHLMGGQMTARNLGGTLTYEVTVTAYRDVLGIPMYAVATFNYSEVGGTWTQANTVPLNGPVAMGNGVEEYTYIDTITFPAGGNYNMWYEDCCRNCALLNIVNPCSYSFHLYTDVWADATNSTPVFLNPPIPVAQIMVPLTYNPLPFDADGDSLSWTLDIPVTSGGVPVAGYTLPPADASNPFAMDPITGVVSFTPNTLGNFEVSVLVNEFRNGVQIGQIRRDMQIIVVSSGNRPLLVSPVSSGSTGTGYNLTIDVSVPFTATVTVLDPDFETLTMNARGEPFLLANNPATSSIINSAGVSTGSVSWTPDFTQMRVAPYILSFRVDEPFTPYIFSNDFTFSLTVENRPTGIAPITKESVRSIYPNPNNGSFTVAIDAVTPGKADLVITNIMGQQVHVAKNVQLNEGLNAIMMSNISLPKGSYMISVVKDGATTSVRNFEVAY